MVTECLSNSIPQTIFYCCRLEFTNAVGMRFLYFHECVHLSIMILLACQVLVKEMEVRPRNLSVPEKEA